MRTFIDILASAYSCRSLPKLFFAQWSVLHFSKINNNEDRFFRAPIFYFMSLLWFASQTSHTDWWSRTFTCAATLSYLQLRSRYVDFSGSPHTQSMLDRRLNWVGAWGNSVLNWKEPSTLGSTCGCGSEKHCIFQLSVPCVTELISETSPSTLVSPRPLVAHRDAVMARSFSTKAWRGHSWAVEAPHVAFCCGDANFQAPLSSAPVQKNWWHI